MASRCCDGVGGSLPRAAPLWRRASTHPGGNGRAEACLALVRGAPCRLRVPVSIRRDLFGRYPVVTGAAVLDSAGVSLVYERARLVKEDGIPTHTLTSYYLPEHVEGTPLVDPSPGP